MTRVTQQVPLEEQTLITLSDHQSAFPVFRGVRVAQSLVLCEVFCRSLYPFLSVIVYLHFFDLRLPITPLLYLLSLYDYDGFLLSYQN